ncbi:hypothetical protein LMG29542_02192 [Paraburkholderia humisilvae]|uniref:Uncharacterized protein n=2 Tax=Paraburkholderia humisilvae TaxID=627669 RepID=A0A6J5DII6_9BURK|nr:hypothetical protein LMG29542_02192 [Paraburkholderia humisilvae]
MLLLSRDGAGENPREVASEWVRDGRNWVCLAAEDPVRWMLGREAGEVKRKLVADGVEYRLVRNGSLLDFLAAILTGTVSGYGTVVMPIPVSDCLMGRTAREVRAEFGVDLPRAWERIMAWCDGFQIGRIEVFGSDAGRTGYVSPDAPRGIVAANRALRSSVSARVLWFGAMVGVSFGIDLESGLTVGVTDSDRSVWIATRRPAEMIVWLLGLVTMREVAFANPLTQGDWPSFVAGVLASPAQLHPVCERRLPGSTGEKEQFGR